jgi:hypothetical protein
MTEETLFHLALEKPAGERAAFLEAACAGDEVLRRRLEALLRAHEDPASLLDRPAVAGAVAVEQTVAHQPQPAADDSGEQPAVGPNTATVVRYFPPDA